VLARQPGSIGTLASQLLLETARESLNPNIGGAAREALEAIPLRAKEKRPS
jgi:hypothetical protein